MSKEKFDLEVRAEKGEGLIVRGESFDRGKTSKSNFENHKSNNLCRYCRKSGHINSECFKLKNKREKEEDNSHSHPHEPTKVIFVESDSDGDVLFATSTERGSVFYWIFYSGYTYHMRPHKDWFLIYDPVDSTVVHMGDNAQSNVTGIGTIKSRPMMVLSGLHRMFVTFLT